MIATLPITSADKSKDPRGRHEGFDWRKERWTDFATGEPIRRIHTGHRAFGEQPRVLTYAEVARRHFSRVPERMLGTDGRPATERTLGPLEPAPTEVSIVRLIGREMNMLDHAGKTSPRWARRFQRATRDEGGYT